MLVTIAGLRHGSSRSGPMSKREHKYDVPMTSLVLIEYLFFSRPTHSSSAKRKCELGDSGLIIDHGGLALEYGVSGAHHGPFNVDRNKPCLCRLESQVGCFCVPVSLSALDTAGSGLVVSAGQVENMNAVVAGMARFDEQSVCRQCFVYRSKGSGGMQGVTDLSKPPGEGGCRPLPRGPDPGKTFVPRVCPLEDVPNVDKIEALRTIFSRAMRVIVAGGKCHPVVEKYIRINAKKTFKSIDALRREYQEKDETFLVAQDPANDRVVGMVAVRRYGKNSHGQSAQIKHMCVEETYRRHGVGSMLLTQAIAFCQNESRYAQVLLDTLEPMLAARALYARHGFKEVGGKTVGEGTKAFTLVTYRLDL